MIHRPFPSRLENGPIRGANRRTVVELLPFIIFLVTCAVVGSGFIVVRSGIDGIRKEIVTLRREKDSLVEEGRVLHKELASLSSPSRIIPLAQAQGLVFPEAGSFRTLALAELPPDAGGPDGTSPATAPAAGGSRLTALVRGLLHDAVPPAPGHAAAP